jgi:hypothetical protein
MIERRTVRDGIVTGLIAYVSVALFYGVFDFLAARGGLYTVNVLGKALFRGLRDTGVLGVPLAHDTGAILLYNAFHFATSLAIGLIVVRLVEQAETNPAHEPAMFFVIVGGFVVTVLMVGWLTAPIRPLLPFWSIVLANVLATMLAGLYLLRRRPGLFGRFLPFVGMLSGR